MRRRLYSRLIHFFQKPVLHTNRLLNNYKDVLWLIGDGRSGTTWVSALINHARRYREMFEPFHPKFIPQMKFLQPLQYIRTENPHPELHKAADDVFSGKLTHQRVDERTRLQFYRGLLIKDVFANLFAHWASVNFPEIKILLLIRNPFAVALSKQKMEKGFWVSDPLLLLNQASLYRDFLYPFEDLIRNVSQKKDHVLNQVLIWSIINYVPLCQFDPGQLYLLFYEDVYADPEGEMKALYTSFFDKKMVGLDPKTIKRPSAYAGKHSTLRKGKSPLTAWQKELTLHQIDQGLEIINAFGFGGLYENPARPDKQVVYRMLRS